MIRTSLDPGATFAAVFVRPGNSVSYRVHSATNGSTTADDHMETPEQMTLRTPVWIKVERQDDQFSAFYSSYGKIWTPMAWSPQKVSMPYSVYMGLAVASHDNRRTAEAHISHVTTTGGISYSGRFEEFQDIRIQGSALPNAGDMRKMRIEVGTPNN